MWRFTGNITFSCEGCGEEYSVPIEDFDHDVSGEERGMGPEHIHNLIYEIECESCPSTLHVEYDVSEYPLECIDFTLERHEGIADSSRPETESYPEIYSIEDAFQFRSGDVGELLSILECEPDFIRGVGRHEFEDVIAEIFRVRGYKVEQTKKTRDGGKDIIAISSDELGIESKYFIECKHPDEGNKVSVSLVREAYGVHNTRSGPNKTILVTTSKFTRDAKKFVTDEIRSPWEFDLKDYEDVVNWLQRSRE